MTDNNQDCVDAFGGDPAGTDSPDARGGGGGQAGRGGQPPVYTEAEFLAEKYKMDHENRGQAVILNNRDFDRHTGMGTRSGTDVDASNIYQNLKALGFTVEMHTNKTTGDMKKIMTEAAKKDFSNSDCFACVILSHGEEGAVYGTNGPVEIKDLVDPFKGHRCQSLAGKPKLFFIQACRGQGLDEGVDVSDALGVKGDGDEDVEMAPVTYRIPTEADFLMAYSVVPGYFSWRNSSRGSWFIQALCAVLEKYGHKLDLMTMMTRVNKLVAYDFESNASKEFMNRKKQIPCITSMLTKDLYFPPM
ncbi:caspase-3-like isoform X1 [Haliotis rufescens]|uniref:caspase-3-like isoform X2 n=1 Tax=Haliotis rufescens TaxID=6454 RepID=UPI001EB059B9|nr:caspase-3-like isoform X2 [Haliotis rufescens]XP_048248451.1 caspase-3-like isoform X1 [Haliotis rufescens]